MFIKLRKAIRLQQFIIREPYMLNKLYILLLTITMAISCSQEEIPLQNTANINADQHIKVATIVLRAQSFVPQIETVGSIQAAEEIVLSTQLTAPVRTIHFREGQNVKRGDLLLLLDQEKVEISLVRAKEGLEQARSRLQESKDNFTRRKELAKQKTLSQELLDSANHEWQRAKSAVNKAQAEKKLAQRNLADSRIISPINGIIDQNMVEVGETVQKGQDLLLIQATDHLEIKTYVSESDIHFILAGNKAQFIVANWPDRVFSATVSTVGITSDPRTGNFPVTLRINSIDKKIAITLRPGMTTTINIEGKKSQSTLLIPETALVDYQRKQSVFIIQNQRAVLRRPQLQVGLGDQIKVISGLQQGDKIVISSSRPLRDGAIVIQQTNNKLGNKTAD